VLKKKGPESFRLLNFKIVLSFKWQVIFSFWLWIHNSSKRGSSRSLHERNGPPQMPKNNKEKQIMKIESVATSNAAAQCMRSVSEVSRVRKDQGLHKGEQTGPEILIEPNPQDTKVSPSEILENINRVSLDGLYSVRFEKNDALDEFIVKIVDRETDDAITTEKR
jgi:flagellar protein FlaG